MFGKTCHFCGKNSTHRLTKENQPICGQCVLELVESKKTPKACPEDGTVMVNEVFDNYVIKRCPKCRGVFLDREEVQALTKIAEVHGPSTASINLAAGIIAMQGLTKK